MNAKAYQVLIEHLCPDDYMLKPAKAFVVWEELCEGSSKSLTQYIKSSKEDNISPASLAFLMSQADPNRHQTRQERLERIRRELNDYWKFEYTPA